MRIKSIWFFLYSFISLGVGGFIIFMFTSLSAATSSQSIKTNPLSAAIGIPCDIFLLSSFIFTFIGTIGLLNGKDWANRLVLIGVNLSFIAAFLAFVLLTWCNIDISGFKLAVIYQAIILVVLFLTYILPGIVLVKSLK